MTAGRCPSGHTARGSRRPRTRRSESPQKDPPPPASRPSSAVRLRTQRPPREHPTKMTMGPESPAGSEERMRASLPDQLIVQVTSMERRRGAACLVWSRVRRVRGGEAVRERENNGVSVDTACGWCGYARHWRECAAECECAPMFSGPTCGTETATEAVRSPIKVHAAYHRELHARWCIGQLFPGLLPTRRHAYRRLAAPRARVVLSQRRNVTRRQQAPATDDSR